MRGRAATLIVAAALAGCVVMPTTVTGYDPQCRATTRHMTLEVTQVGAIARCSNQECAALVLVAAGVTAATAVVSGSIAVVGNVVYWAEERAGCLVGPAEAASAPQR